MISIMSPYSGNGQGAYTLRRTTTRILIMTKGATARFARPWNYAPLGTGLFLILLLVIKCMRATTDFMRRFGPR